MGRCKMKTITSVKVSSHHNLSKQQEAILLKEEGCDPNSFEVVSFKKKDYTSIDGKTDLSSQRVCFRPTKN